MRDYVENTFRQIAEQKGLAFDITLADTAPATITTDLQRLQQILKNLLSNSFKFTERGRVELRIGQVPAETVRLTDRLGRPSGVIAFSVTDTGIGIPVDKQSLIFEAFQQADASTGRMYGGTGLGLTISRELARLLGGEISVRSVPAEGSTFTLFLPDDRTASAQPAAAATTIDSGGGSGSGDDAPLVELTSQLEARKVLIIDDDARNLFAVTSLLERSRVDVVAASTAQEGLSLLSEHPDVQLVLMDIMLPGMDGYQATRAIRDSQAHADLPVIALTAKAMPGDREKCLAAGCTDFVPKPVDSRRLLSAMVQALGRR